MSTPLPTWEPGVIIGVTLELGATTVAYYRVKFPAIRVIRRLSCQ
jgi:hypothetical protein